jgi:hypothetical protein
MSSTMPRSSDDSSSGTTLHSPNGPSSSPALDRIPTHDDARADISFPALTTDLARAGYTSEYRAVAPTGLVRADTALQPIPTRLSRVPTVLADKEQARALKDVQLVTWKDGDPEDPRNWSKAYKWYITAVCALSVVSAAFGSAVVTGDFRGIEEEFGVSEVVVALSVSLMVVGFGLGPLAWSPLVRLLSLPACEERR